MTEDYKRAQRKEFEEAWPDYNREPVVLSPAQQFWSTVEFQATEELLERSGLTAMDRLLVCGVGAGDDVHYWLSHLRVRACVGLDFAFEGLRATQRRLLGHKQQSIVQWVQADIEALPFTDGSADLVIVARSLHHLLDPGLGVRELFRVSRRGLAILEPADSFLMPLFKWIGIAQHTEDAGNIVLRFTRSDFEQYLNGQAHSLSYRKCLYYYHPWLNRRLIRLFDFPGGVHLLRGLHRVASVLFPFLHSKGIALITKGERGSA
jgi:ubiquinone/menaquinone biosynthesis C-methylase UbiE